LISITRIAKFPAPSLSAISQRIVACAVAIGDASSLT
jgi:hypothetical protein